MCDTVVAVGSATADGNVLFAKNSDRDANEAHHLRLVPRARHVPGSRVRCTYVEVPQVETTYAVLLAKPFWIWGAEMGANECGVVIGNEAVYGRFPVGHEPGLIGMDFIRLALERASTARQALDTITGLLERYGQSGRCSLVREHAYHNSYLLADPHGAWVLEMAGRAWAAERVRDVRAISNTLTIGADFDLASPGLVEHAVRSGWCASAADFHFARCYTDPGYARRAGAEARQCRATELLEAARGRVTVATLTAVLRDHGADAGPDFTPTAPAAHPTICMHPAPPERPGSSVGSLVSHLTPDRQTHFLTGTAAPCLSLFKPVWLDAGLPGTGPDPTDQPDAASLWWRHEALHRATLRDYPARLALYREERDRLEANCIRSALAAAATPAADRGTLSARCFAEADAALARWTEAVTHQTRDRAGLLAISTPAT